MLQIVPTDVIPVRRNRILRTRYQRMRIFKVYLFSCSTCVNSYCFGDSTAATRNSSLTCLIRVNHVCKELQTLKIFVSNLSKFLYFKINFTKHFFKIPLHKME